MHIHRLTEEMRKQGLDGFAERIYAMPADERPTLAAIEARLRDLGYRDLALRVARGEFDG